MASGDAQKNQVHGRGRKVARIVGAVVCLVAVAVLVLGALSCVFMPKNNSPEAGIHEAKAHSVLGEPADTVDVFLVGNSEVYTSLITLQMWNEYGFTSYALSTSGQIAPSSFSQLREALKTQTPKIVVFETDSLFTPASISDGIMQALEDVFPLVEYHDRWKSLTADDFTAAVEYTWTDYLKGVKIERDVKSADPEKIAQYGAESSEVTDMIALNKWYLREMVEYVRAQGAIPVLYSAPSVEVWDMKKHNGAAQYAEELGIAYYDLNLYQDVLNIDWTTETCDGGDHLNYSGATRVTSLFSSLLDEAYDLPDHRGDTTYRSWDNAYAAYVALLATGENYSEAKSAEDE